MLDSATPLASTGSVVNSGPVHCVENHDGAYTIWRDAGVARRVLVHVDAHHDMYGRWIGRKDPKERSRITIANFVYAALEYDLVREVIWVVPEQTWDTPAGRRDIASELKGLDQGVGRNKAAIRIRHDRIMGTVLGKPVQACTARNLPVLHESVLLDIDVDYFVIPNVGYRGIGSYGARPWCWPAELLAQLEARGVRTDLTTIAYSVEGGYTPMQWKYLGDELAQRLQAVPVEMAWAERMREAARAAGRGDFRSAETHYLSAHALRPGLAAPCYHLAHLCAASGRLEAGREFLREACAADASYRSPYNNAGWWYLEKRRHDQAQTAFARTLSLDPADAYAHLGCGMLAIRKRNWPAAQSSLRRALALDERCVEAYRALGQVLARRGSYAEAVDAYEHSLKLTLSGRRALTNQITLSQGHDWRTPWDPDHGVVLAELARLHTATREWKKATTDYRMAIAAGGINAAGAWARLAALYARLGRWRDCVHAISRAVQSVPHSLTDWLKRLWARCLEAIDRWRDRRAPNALHEDTPTLWI